MTVMTFARRLGNPKAAPPAPKPELPMTFVFTDGGCDMKKSGVGGWAWSSTRLGYPTRQTHSAMIGTTVNRMELMAVIDALEFHDGGRITIYSDSQYVIKGLTEWSAGWVAHGWLTGEGKPVKNRDLWERLLAIARLRKPIMHHVKGHSGVAGNELVDKLCTAAMKAAHARFEAGEPVPHDTLGKHSS